MVNVEPNAQISALLAGIPQAGNALGVATAPVTLEYFGDLQCPFSRDFSLRVLPSIIDRWVRAERVRAEYHALQTATGDPEVFVAQQAAVLAAGRQAKAWQFLETFYEQQGKENSGYVTDSFLHGIALQIEDLNVEQWAGERGDADLIKEIAADRLAAGSAGLSGTPSFLIGRSGGSMRPFSATDPASFDQAIEGLVR